MSVILFALFFIVYLSLFYLAPAVILKKLTKVTRKRKINNIIKDYSLFAIITTIYVIIYLIMYNVFSDSIKYITDRGLPKVFINNTTTLGIVSFLFLLITFIYTVYTYVLSSKLFAHKKDTDGYIAIGIFALFSILTYYSFYTILGLNNYTFENNFILNTIYQFDYDMATYLFFVMVLIKLAISFVKE
ncbi:MAG: hypothetical protein IKQ35_04410 [Bacilli bacterium]|nr:hypothetical protein [Bacilli bacterium]